MKAITVDASGKNVVVQEVPIPPVRPTYLLVKTAVVAANPADHLCLQYGLAKPGGNLGCDWAGTVVEVGEGVERSFKPGDRVCGCAKPTDLVRKDVGCFAEYVVVKADIAIAIPDSMSFTDAASLGVSTITTGRCLFDTFNIPYPKPPSPSSAGDDTQGAPTTTTTTTTTSNPRKILIYGGSTSTGTMLIQFAKLAGLFVLSTASPHNTSLVTSYGADVVVDHHSATAAAELAAQHGPLDWCVDTIGTPPSSAFCSTVLLTPPPTDEQQQQQQQQQGNKIYSVLTPLLPELPGTTTARTVGYSFLNEEYEQMGQVFAASREDFERSRDFMVLAGQLLAAGKIRPHPVEVREGGLAGIENGLKELMEMKVSGKKLVYPL